MRPMLAPRLPLAALVFLGCASAALYDGPPRPDSEVATIIPTSVTIRQIDQRRAPDARLKVLPGVHAIVAYLDDPDTNERISARPVDPYEADCTWPTSPSVPPPAIPSWSPTWKLTRPAWLNDDAGAPPDAAGPG